MKRYGSGRGRGTKRETKIVDQDKGQLSLYGIEKDIAMIATTENHSTDQDGIRLCKGYFEKYGRRKDPGRLIRPF